MPIENIYNAVEQLRKATKEKQNQAILTVVAYCIENIDDSAPISRPMLFSICTKSGLTKILRDAAKTTDAFGGELQKATDECERLEKEAESSLAELEAIKRQTDEKAKIQKRLDAIRRDIEAAQTAQYEYEQFMVELRKLGIDTSNMSAPDFASKTQAFLQERERSFKSKTNALSDIVYRAGQARKKFERAQQESSTDLVKIYEDSADDLQEYTKQTKDKLSIAEGKLEDELKRLAELQENLEMATSRHMDAEKEIQKYIEAFKCHREENQELYSELKSNINVDGLGELIGKLKACESTLDIAFKPYERVLKYLMVQSQEKLNSTIARIEDEYKIDLSRSKKD